MKRPTFSAKRIAVDKTNASLIIIVATSMFIVVFSLVATKALYSQFKYQSRVINKKEITLKQIEQNIQEVDKLNVAYSEFSGGTTNAIGGNPRGSGDKDGENARIILDALPSKYDYPALATSLDKLARDGGFVLSNIQGVDDEINQSANSSAVTPTAVEMPFSIEANVKTSDGKDFLELFERSIRPIKLTKLSVTAQENELRVEMEAKTYFQPAKKLNVSEEVVR